MTTENKTLKILIGKPGLDGHDVGAKIVVRALMDAGFDAIYTGLKKTPQDIVRQALEEQVDVLGLSILSGSHLPICEEMMQLLQQHNLQDLVWIVGGNIPQNDHDALKKLGVDAVFSVGTALETIVDFIRGTAR